MVGGSIPPRPTTKQDAKRRQKPPHTAIEANPDAAIDSSAMTENESDFAVIPPSDFGADLARVVNTWPNLPEHIRAVVLALAGTNAKRGDK